MELYGEAWARRFDELAEAAIAGRVGLFRIAEACFAALPDVARVLVVGCGTGSELLHLAARRPGWRFEAVEPADAMRAECERRVEASGLAERVRMHAQPLAGLRVEPCDAATAILVAQHVVDDADAAGFFRDVAANLAPNAPFFSADVSAPSDPLARSRLLDLWQAQAGAYGVPVEELIEMRGRFERDVRLRAPEAIERALAAAGLGACSAVFQSLIYRAWVSRKPA